MTPPDQHHRSEWEQEGTFEVAPGVFRLPLPLPNDGLKAVNVYLLRDGDRLTVVDSGWVVPEARIRLEQGLAAIGAGLGDVDRFLITHAHLDHYTQAVAVRKEYPTRIALGEGERPSVEALLGPDRTGMGEQGAQLERAGAHDLVEELRAAMGGGPPPTDEFWEAPDDWLQDGERVVVADRTLDVVETPGHTRGHVVFHDVAGSLLFAGDHVLPHITPSIGLEARLVRDPLGDYLRSLALVRARPDAVLLPAHGPVGPSVHARVDELIDHHGRRLDASLEAIANGAVTSNEAAALLPWTRRERKLADLDLFNRMLAIRETDAHLYVLRAQGRLTSQIVDGVEHWAVA